MRVTLPYYSSMTGNNVLCREYRGTVMIQRTGARSTSGCPSDGDMTLLSPDMGILKIRQPCTLLTSEYRLQLAGRWGIATCNCRIFTLSVWYCLQGFGSNSIPRSTIRTAQVGADDWGQGRL
jgi:hypothetical protein